MQPISDMPGDDFMKLQSLYAADLPINAECTLEDARQVLNWLIFAAPKDETSERVRYVLDRLLLIVTAPVSHRTDAERDDQVLS